MRHEIWNMNVSIWSHWFVTNHYINFYVLIQLNTVWVAIEWCIKQVAMVVVRWLVWCWDNNCNDDDADNVEQWRLSVGWGESRRQHVSCSAPAPAPAGPGARHTHPVPAPRLLRGPRHLRPPLPLLAPGAGLLLPPCRRHPGGLLSSTRTVVWVAPVASPVKSYHTLLSSVS